MVEYSDDDKSAAILIALRTDVSEASRATGVDPGIIHEWLNDRRHKRIRERVRMSINHQRIDLSKQASSEVSQLVRSEVREVMKDQIADIREEVHEEVRYTIKQIVDDLQDVLGDAVAELASILSEGPSSKDKKSEWLRSVTFLMEKAAANHQLLIGKPTSIWEHQGGTRDSVSVRLERYAAIYAKMENIASTIEEAADDPA